MVVSEAAVPVPARRVELPGVTFSGGGAEEPPSHREGGSISKVREEWRDGCQHDWFGVGDADVGVGGQRKK